MYPPTILLYSNHRNDNITHEDSQGHNAIVGVSFVWWATELLGDHSVESFPTLYFEQNFYYYSNRRYVYKYKYSNNSYDQRSVITDHIHYSVVQDVARGPKLALWGFLLGPFKKIFFVMVIGPLMAL